MPIFRLDAYTQKAYQRRDAAKEKYDASASQELSKKAFEKIDQAYLRAQKHLCKTLTSSHKSANKKLAKLLAQEDPSESHQRVVAIAQAVADKWLELKQAAKDELTELKAELDAIEKVTNKFC